MKLTTEEIRILKAADPCCHPLEPLCRAAGVNHTALYQRIRRGGDATEEEQAALGGALAASLPKRWVAILVLGNNVANYMAGTEDAT